MYLHPAVRSGRPSGATPIDFAYAIHSGLGHERTGARVNGSQVSLKYEMQNGDVVEIQRTRGSKPKPHWTQIVRTGRAATKIRAFLRQEENARAAQIGQEVFERELRRYGLSDEQTAQEWPTRYGHAQAETQE